MTRYHHSTFTAFYTVLATLLMSFNTYTTEPVVTDRFQANLPHSLVNKVDQARFAREKGDSVSALQELEKVVQTQPDYYRAQYHLGLTAAALNQSEQAETAFKNAEALRSAKSINDTTFYNSYGWFALTNNRFDEAERLFSKASKDESNMDDITRQRLYNNVGVLALKQEDIARALACFQIAAELGSELAKQQLETLSPTTAEKGNSEEHTTDQPNQGTINTARHCFTIDLGDEK